MKPFAVFAVMLLFFLVVTRAEAEKEAFQRIVFGPGEISFDSDGNVEHSYRRVPRSVRQNGACPLPKTLNDFQLDCKLYPNRILCTQTCIFGHTLSDGIQREMKCRYEENKWTPTATFEKCQPFVDCTLTIGPGGKFKCYTNYLEKGNTCDVSCQHYEDKPAVPTESHQCDINGNWTPKLPFCARAKTGLRLVPPPKGPKVISKRD